MPSPILKYIQGQRLNSRQLRKLVGKPKEAKRLKKNEEPEEEIEWEGNEEDF